MKVCVWKQKSHCFCQRAVTVVEKIYLVGQLGHPWIQLDCSLFTEIKDKLEQRRAKIEEGKKGTLSHSIPTEQLVLIFFYMIFTNFKTD